MKRTLWLPAMLMVAGASGAQEPARPDLHAVPGWFLGMPLLLRIEAAPEGADPRKLPTFPVYVHAPVSPTAGAAPMKMVQRPGRGEVALPPHQDTLSSLNVEKPRRIAVGYFVLRGPKGDEDTVRVQPQPEKSWPSSPLVAEIRIGTEWVKVNSHLVIEYGLATGLVALEFFDVGAVMYGEFYDDEAAKLGGVDVRIGAPAALPAIDWKNDRDYRPGQPSRE